MFCNYDVPQCVRENVEWKGLKCHSCEMNSCEMNSCETSQVRNASEGIQPLKSLKSCKTHRNDVDWSMIKYDNFERNDDGIFLFRSFKVSTNIWMTFNGDSSTNLFQWRILQLSTPTQIPLSPRKGSVPFLGHFSFLLLLFPENWNLKQTRMSLQYFRSFLFLLPIFSLFFDKNWHD